MSQNKAGRILSTTSLLILMWMLVATAGSADAYVQQKSEVERLQTEFDRMEAEFNMHVRNDYATFNQLHQLDREYITKLEVRLAVLESAVSANTKLLWSIVAAVALQVLILFIRAFRVVVAANGKGK